MPKNPTWSAIFKVSTLPTVQLLQPLDSLNLKSNPHLGAVGLPITQHPCPPRVYQVYPNSLLP